MSDGLRDRVQASLGDAYSLDRELGGGGMSRVFVARDNALGRDVVVKVLAPELAEGLSAERFAREIRLAAALQEPHIVPVHAAGVTADGLPWYTMPYVEGESLRARLERGPVSLAEARKILGDVARALAYAHARGIVHRDIKPENVLLSSGTAVVTDFGIAKALQLSKTQASDALTGMAAGTLTHLGTSLGTPAYMAPEQAAGDPNVDGRADLYAWGVLAYELLAGAHPFAGRAPHQLVLAHVSETPAPLATTPGGVSRGLTTLVMRCLEKDPARRPATAAEILATLDSGGESSIARSPRWSRGAAAAIMLLLLAGAAIIALRARTAHTVDAASIAVLPFENQGAPEQAYFADGLTDAVTGKLIGVAGLTVIDRRSAVTYRDTKKTAVQIGSELGVAFLLEGVVRWARDGAGPWRAQVTPTLVRTRDGVSQWAGEPVVVTTADPFTAQAEIASKVVGAIGLAIGARERASLAIVPTRDPAAYELYLRAVSVYRDRSPTSVRSVNLDSAATLLEHATRLDPRFALAFAELANVEYSRSGFDTAASRRHQAAVRAALALDPELPEAHFARARHLWFRESRFAEALASGAHAVAGKPGDAEMLSSLGAWQISSGKTSEGFANLERAMVLDPRDFQSNRDAAYFDFHFRRLEAAERDARRMIAITPQDWTGHMDLMLVAAARGDTSGERRFFAEGVRSTGQLNATPSLVWTLTVPFALLPAPVAAGATWPARMPTTDPVASYVAAGAWNRESGATDRGRANFDTALVAARTPQLALIGRSIYVVPRAGLMAVALAGVGRAAEARRAIAFGDSVQSLNALPSDPIMASGQIYFAYAFLLLDERDAALARLERALALPSGVTPAMLRTMWPFRSLRGDARFRKLAEMVQ